MPNRRNVAFITTPLPVTRRRNTLPAAPRTYIRLPPTFTTPRAEMVRVSVPLKIEAPNSYCFELFSDLSNMPEWSSALEAVTRDSEDPSFSEWNFAWNGIRLSWRARDVENMPNHSSDVPAIRWRSVSGLVHTGEVQFENLQPTATKMIMTVDYDIESLVAAIMRSSVVSNFVEGAIESDLSRFRSYALRKYRKAKMSTGA
ncbi:unnamed protein product [Agarophyton chilense]